MEKARILIVEDQVVTAKSIASMAEEEGMEVIGICKSGEEGVALADKRMPDIVIMDIRLQGKMDGIQAAAAIKEIYNIPVIYLSDHTDSTTLKKAKPTRPANFLSKPFTAPDLLRAIDIAIYNANAARAIESNGNEEFIFIKTNPQPYGKLEYNNIMYIEADRAYCNIHASDKIHTQSMSMASLAEQLSPSIFVKIHRSYIVNIRKVREFSGSEVTIAGKKLPVSDQHRTELMKRLKVIH